MRTDSFATYLYWSGGTFFTLGYGDITPSTVFGRVLAVVEAGMGFGFLALIIGYLPVIYQTFSRREMMIALLDARAGSPPSAAQLLIRVGQSGNIVGDRSVSGRVGTLVGRAAGKPSVVSGAELLPLAARQPIVALVADGGARYVRGDDGDGEGSQSVSGAADVRDEPARGGRFGAGIQGAADGAAAVDRLPPERAATTSRFAERRRFHVVRRRSGRSETRRAATACTSRLSAQWPSDFCSRCRSSFPTRPSADNWQRSAWMKRAPGIGSLPIAPPAMGILNDRGAICPNPRAVPVVSLRRLPVRPTNSMPGSSLFRRRFADKTRRRSSRHRSCLSLPTPRPRR